MATKPATTQERIGRVGQRRQVVIPREMLETLNIQEGDFVAFAQQHNGVLIKAKRLVDPDDTLTFAQQHNGVLIKAKRLVDPDDTLTPAEAEVVRRGEAQLKRGQSKPWRAVKHALAR